MAENYLAVGRMGGGGEQGIINDYTLLGCCAV